MREHETGYRYLFLVCGRKAWHFQTRDTEGWDCVAEERFSFVECSIWRKTQSTLTAHDWEMLCWHGRPPEGWIWPSGTAAETFLDAQPLLQSTGETP